MDEPGAYKGGSQGILYGVLAALFFAVFVGFAWIAAMGLGDCFDESCEQGRERGLRIGLAIVLVLAAFLAVSIRALVRWAEMKRHYGPQVGLPPVWAVVAAAPLLLLGAAGGLLFLVVFLG